LFITKFHRIGAGILREGGVYRVDLNNSMAVHVGSAELYITSTYIFITWSRCPCVG